MSEQETPPAPAIGTPGQPATGTPSTSTGATPTKPSIEELQARIAELEKHNFNKTEEASRHGKNLSEAQKKLAAYEEKERLAQEATLSEIEKSQKAVEAEKAARAALEQQIQQMKQELILEKVQRLAISKGIVDPELAAMAIQKSLEFGDDGMPTNVDKALDDLIKSKPYLVPPKGEVPPESPAQTSGNQSPPRTPAMNPGRSAISAPQTLQPNQRVSMDQAYQMSKSKRQQ